MLPPIILASVVADAFCGEGWVFNTSLGGCSRLALPSALEMRALRWHHVDEAPLPRLWRAQAGIRLSPQRERRPYLLRITLDHVVAGQCVCVEASGVGAAVPLPRVPAFATGTTPAPTPPPPAAAAAATWASSNP